jgi:hypothetical protein
MAAEAMVMGVTDMVVTVVSCMSAVTVMAVTVVATGMAAQPIGTDTAIGMGTAIGMVAIGGGMAIGIGGMVGGGPMVLALVGELFLAAGFGSVTDSACPPLALSLPRMAALFQGQRGRLVSLLLAQHPESLVFKGLIARCSIGALA